METTLPGYLTTAKAAIELGITPGRVRQLADKLHAIRFSGILLVPAAEVAKRKRKKPEAGRPKKAKAAP